MFCPQIAGAQVYAYPWFTAVRKILDDPKYSAWFLKFSGAGPWNSPNCDKNYEPPLCTDYFHTQMDTPTPTTTWGPRGHPEGGYGKCYPKNNQSGCDCGTKPCGFYVFNHSSAAVINGQSFRDWFLDTYMFNEVGASKLVDGFYWDDTWTPTARPARKNFRVLLCAARTLKATDQSRVTLSLR